MTRPPISSRSHGTWKRQGRVLPRRVRPECPLTAIPLAQGWTVRFDEDPTIGLPAQRVVVPPSKLAIGLSFGSSMAAPGRSFFTFPSTLGRAYNALAPANRFRGAMFWCAELDNVPGNSNGTNATLWMAKALNEVLGTR